MKEVNDDIFDLSPELAAGVEAVRQKNSLDPKMLTAALMTTDDDVELPGKSRPASLVSNLLALAPGECFTKSHRVPDNESLTHVQANMNEWKSQLRQTMNQAIRKAKQRVDRTFVMESVHTFTPSGFVYLQVIVTRTA
jgi:hypothetical protein